MVSMCDVVHVMHKEHREEVGRLNEQRPYIISGFDQITRVNLVGRVCLQRHVIVH